MTPGSAEIEEEGESAARAAAGLDLVLHLLCQREGVDLFSYRRPTLERRIMGRMQKLGFQDYHAYLDRLNRDPDEARLLLEQVTIKVSRFFRNAAAFNLVRDVVLPDLSRMVAPGDPLRFWSAGCGNGEEAYSLAILAQELAGRDYAGTRAMIYGTDIDETALARAREGIYGKETLEETPSELSAAYFVERPGRFGKNYQVQPGPAAKVEFLRHDLISETAGPRGLRFHLVLCRNVVIYYERSAQERLFRPLMESLLPGGYLLLGEAEQLPGAYRSHFDTVDRAARLFRRPDRLQQSPDPRG